MDRAGAAITLVANFLGSGELQVVTQHIKQCPARLNGKRSLHAVHGDR